MLHDEIPLIQAGPDHWAESPGRLERHALLDLQLFLDGTVLRDADLGVPRGLIDAPLELGIARRLARVALVASADEGTATDRATNSVIEPPSLMDELYIQIPIRLARHLMDLVAAITQGLARDAPNESACTSDEYAHGATQPGRTRPASARTSA